VAGPATAKSLRPIVVLVRCLPTAAATCRRQMRPGCNRHSWRNAAMRSAMVNLPSMLTPRLSTADDGLTRADNSVSSVVVSLASCGRVPSHTSCVLSAFILSLLLRIQALMHSTQAIKRCVETNADAAGALTCVSSAYECPTSLALEMMSNNSAVYNRNSNWLRTEPCGTPKSSSTTADSCPL